MRGTMIIVRTDGTTTVTAVAASPDLDTLRTSIGGGWLEQIPGFNQFPLENGKHQPAVAFCDEEGKLKPLPVNEAATQMWCKVLKLSPPSYMPDVLRGDVVILTGEEAFMRSLSSDGDEDDEQ